MSSLHGLGGRVLWALPLLLLLAMVTLALTGCPDGGSGGGGGGGPNY